jgi:methionine biosynthesis protein MetW
LSESFVPKLLGRSDYAIISAIIEPKARVLDLGCGEGELLAWLAENKRVDARGVEIEGAKVRQAISRGVSVFHSDIEDALADLPDQAFDYVILSQTLQESRAPLKVLREMLRVGRRAIVAFPNFGHWSENWTIEKRIFLQGARQVTFLPNLIAEVAVFLVRAS